MAACKRHESHGRLEAAYANGGCPEAANDPAIAALGSQRFVAGLFLAIPAGLWLRGRPLRKITFPVMIGRY